MKLNSYAGLALVIVSIFLQGCMGCARVEQGYTGLLVDNYGSERGGEEAIQEVYGKVHYNSYTQDLYTNPNFVQRSAWTEGADEGSEHDEAFRIMSQDQLEFTVDVGFSWLISPEEGCSAKLFRKYRKPAATLANTEIRDIVRATVQDVFSEYNASQIYGDERSEVIDEVNVRVREELGRVKSDGGVSCFQVEDFRLLRLAPPAQISQAVEKKIAAEQKAQQAEKELVTVQMNARADSIRAAQKARDNQILERSITPELIEYEKLQLMKEKWDGTLPRVVTGSGGGGLLLNID